MYIRALEADPNADVKFVVGIPFQSHVGFHTTGDILEDIWDWPNLEAMVSTHFLYPYVGDQDYDLLPAHVFNAVHSKPEVDAELEKHDTGPLNPANKPKKTAAKKSAVAAVQQMESGNA